MQGKPRMNFPATAAALINAWNRIAIPSRIEYHAPHHKAAKAGEAAPAGEMTVG